ncbi:PREDICTED: protein RRNAD1-like [Priapulus caudatus]|uniref:Protein RRNAD1-like n=1 Tax=Priapulus caudatus TaxID=37621 RepID=A0ABM1E292_PRICU|nr:PREDICTED: protein RRNAD1-like [Priapulus caudatus]
METGKCPGVWPLSLLAYREATRAMSFCRKPSESFDVAYLNLKDKPSKTQLGSDETIGLHIERQPNVICSTSIDTNSRTAVTNIKDQQKHNLFKKATTFLWRCAADELSKEAGQHKYLGHCYRKHVKPKKQHEIGRLAQVVAAVCTHNHTTSVLDMGSGQGHLSRLLAFGYGLSVTSVEADSSYTNGAEKFDREVKESIRKEMEREGREKIDDEYQVKYINQCIKPDISVKDFNSLVGNQKGCVLVGLHTCGDLGPTILKLFTKSDHIKAIVSVGCCYMKIANTGYVMFYPLLSLIAVNEPKLKLHCYRAKLEWLLKAYKPELHGTTSIGTIRHAENMSFTEYIEVALKKLGCNRIATADDVELAEYECAASWRRVVAFYALRLLLAPVLESVILCDRMLYLYENGINCTILPVFDPMISPRNLVVVATKSKEQPSC